MRKRTYHFGYIAVMFAICVSLSGCWSKKYSVSTVSGLYEEELGIYGRLMSFRVSLNPDGTYSYRYRYDMMDYSSDGNWWIEGKNVILSSFIHDNEPFQMNVCQMDTLSQTDEIIVLCSQYQYLSSKRDYQEKHIYFLRDDDTIAVNTDSMRIKCNVFPDTINMLIEIPGDLTAKSTDVVIKNAGVYQFDIKSFVLQLRHTAYIEMKKRKFKILRHDRIQDIEATNFILKKMPLIKATIDSTLLDN